jgi:cellulose synthase (UDP-forming)
MGESYAGNSNSVIKVNKPKRKETIIIRSLITCGLGLMIAFLWWFIDPDHVGYAPVFWLLTTALVFKLVKMLHEWYHYWSVDVPQAPVMTKQWKVDMLTTACPGEPKEMIIDTLRAMQAVRYPHTSYLCDEGDDPELREVCRQLGVVHVTRTEKTDAKAGNINNALKQATGEICVVLDPDHVPCPEFLDRVLPYFEDEKVGYVQVVQAYGNQSESLIALGAAEQTYHFYGPMMMCMHTYGTVQAIGANCTFRRAALDSIGGHAPGLSEDMHTAMRIHAQGWKSMYVPEVLSRGLVPATLPAYYKQQLKWSRGTFDLLFKVYPKLFKNFTWRQKLHYLTLPLYFLFGLVNLFDILIPIVALLLAEVPWAVELENFAWLFVPLCMTSLMIRVYAQRWLLEEHEKGFHLAGGILRTGTWWIFLMGFIYTIFNIKVPYIPTPKNDEPVNNWKLGMPNLIACLASIAAAIYGLSIDWNPYSFCMAGYALLNAAILGFVFMIGQEKLLRDIKKWLSLTYVWDRVFVPVSVMIQKVRLSFYGMFRNGTLVFTVFAAVLFLNYTKVEDPIEISPYAAKDVGGFYTGVYAPSGGKQVSFEEVDRLEASLSTRFDIVSVYHAWGDGKEQELPVNVLETISARGAIPMITWEPWTSTFSKLGDHPDLSKDRKVFAAVNEGVFDDYLQKCAIKIRDFHKPVFIRFAHEADNPAYPWSAAGGNTAAEFRKAWERVVSIFVDNGVSNVSWVWNPWKPEAVSEYFPGPNYVDWVGINVLDYGKAGKDGKSYSFSELYEPYRKAMAMVAEMKNKPVMIAELGCAGDDDRDKWIGEALGAVGSKYREIRSVVFYNNAEDKNFAPGRPEGINGNINWALNDASCKTIREKIVSAPFNDKPLRSSWLASSGVLNDPEPANATAVKGEPGNFSLMVNGKPFYIKGVAYNPAHDWRDGNVPLTRKQLESDFTKIKAMGANTIRRYHPGVYDRNILNIAEEYGFWFDPKIDFFTDSVKMKKYINEVESTVEEYRDHPAVLGWSVGNETWGLLKHKYGQPYLAKVRNEYVKFIEYLAQRIHAIDPGRPVLTVMEHSWQLPSEVAAFRKGAPSVDIIGVNSYYEEQIGKLYDIIHQFDTLRPYIVSEFGPKGYWNPEYSDMISDSILVEAADRDKAALYVKEWTDYVQKHKGWNVGGFAYCWRDRMEGTSTWFGLIDYKGRLKPQYTALREMWTGKDEEQDVEQVSIIAPRGALEPGKLYVFTAAVQGSSDVELEWFMHKDEYLDEVEIIKHIEGGRKALVRVPSEPSDYRIYVYAADKKGNVVTASQAVAVQGKNKAIK